MSDLSEIAVLAPAGVVFDYAALPAELVDDLKEAADRVRGRHRRITSDIIETGNDLLAVKERLPHGSFGPWISAEFGWSERTARNYMSAADFAVGKTETVAILPPRSLYLLSASSTPEAARAEIVSRLEGGEAPSGTWIRDTILDAKRKDAPSSRSAGGRRALAVLKIPVSPRQAARVISEHWSRDMVRDLIAALEARIAVGSSA